VRNFTDRPSNNKARAGVVAASFLEAIIGGADAKTGLAAAAASADNGGPIAAITTEIPQAGFTRLVPNTRREG